jgi:hypothetical protein
MTAIQRIAFQLFSTALYIGSRILSGPSPLYNLPNASLPSLPESLRISMRVLQRHIAGPVVFPDSRRRMPVLAGGATRFAPNLCIRFSR